MSKSTIRFPSDMQVSNTSQVIFFWANEVESLVKVNEVPSHVNFSPQNTAVLPEVSLLREKKRYSFWFNCIIWRFI